MQYFTPNPTLGDLQSFGFRPLSGHTEYELIERAGSAFDKCQWLLSQVGAFKSFGDTQLDVSDLTITEFDRVLVNLYLQLYGSKIDCESNCKVCDHGFEFDLSLEDVVERQTHERASYQFNEQHVATDKDETISFRLPRVKDLKDLLREPIDAWMKALDVSGICDEEQFQNHLEKAAPTLSFDVSAICPECESVNSIRFDIAAYLLSSLENEAAFLWRESHLLAQIYGWTLPDIFALPRNARRNFARMITAEMSAMRRVS